ncbi:MAG: hypothetical protein JWO22_2748 [Frankiales bacterium]|nr:hypothetical protein [Frankiales bacterium]
MSSSAEGSSHDPVDDAERSVARRESNDAWAATSLLISGVLVWGGVGYLVSLWLGSPLFTMAGLLVGTATALYGIWFRYGRS